MTVMQNRPRALFSPGRSLPGEAPGHRQPKGLFGAQEWVVARSDCQYRQQDFSALPPRKRLAAARLAAARFLPQPRSRVHLAWQGALAHYWIWTPDGEVAADYRRWLPETLLLAPPAQDGLRLLALSRGVEGQLWRAGMLVASQWWARHPTDAEWLNFLRASGWAGDAAMPVVETLEWLERPWAQSGRHWSVDADTAERMAWIASGCLLLAVLGWQVTSLLRWDAAARAEAARVDVARAKTAPLQAARERAESAVADIQALRDLEPGYSDYDWMVRIAAKLPQGTQLAGWAREPGKLRVLARGGDPDPRRVIEAFLDAPPFDNLTATPTGSGDMLLEFELPAPRATEGSAE